MKTSEMSVKELREVVVTLKVLSEAKAKMAKKEELVAVLDKYEAELLKKKEKESKKVVETAEFAVEEDLFEGKEVVSRADKQINGKNYEEITVKGGVVFAVPKL